MLMTASDISDSDLLRELTSLLKIDCLIQKPISFMALKRIIQKQELLHMNSSVGNDKMISIR
jgi:hypothetical protein